MKKYGDLGVNKYAEMGDGRVVKGMRVLRREGPTIFMHRLGLYFKRKALTLFTPLIIAVKPKRHFYFKDIKIPYFLHKKSLTWANERAIEIPVIANYIRRYQQEKSGKVLEVGAVLPHYFPKMQKDTLDKFEKRGGIINEDVINYNPTEKYGLIVSISTLEHVGFDDDVKDPQGPAKAIKNLRNNCLQKGGEMIITLPIGYNQAVDEAIFANSYNFDEELFYKRKSGNIWQQIPKEKAYGAKYVNQSSVIVFGFVRR